MKQRTSVMCAFGCSPTVEEFALADRLQRVVTLVFECRHGQERRTVSLHQYCNGLPAKLFEPIHQVKFHRANRPGYSVLLLARKRKNPTRPLVIELG